MKFLKNLSNHALVKNFFALVILQVANYLFPLLAFPVLAKFLGVDGFGEFMVILAVLSMAMLFTDFGFNLSATHTISLERENKEKVAQLLGNIFFIKLILAVIAIVVVLIYLQYEDKLQHLTLISFILIVLTIAVQSLQCIWFFQGIEKMKNITIATISSKVIYLLLLCVLLPFWASVETAVFCFFISQLMMIGIYLKAVYKEGYIVSAPKFAMVGAEIKHSFSFFLSRMAISLHSLANTIVIGSVNGTTAAGLYGAAEKLYGAGVSVSSMLSQALFPHMARTNNLKLLVKIVGLTAIPYFLGCYVLYHYAEEIMVLVFGEAFKQGAEYLELFFILMCISFLSMSLGYPSFAAIKKVNFANHTTIIASIFHLIGLIVLYQLNSINAYNILLLVMATNLITLILRSVLLIYFSLKSREI